MSINKAQFITSAEMAKMLGISRVAIHKQIVDGKIPAEKVGRNYLIPKSALPADLQERIKGEQQKATKTVLEKNSHHDLDFEKELWAAADKLRGNIDVSEYKNIVLGLLFLKYISDAFYKRREGLEALTRDPKNEDFYVKDDKARAQILETKDFYKSAGVFYVPEKSRWEYLQTKTMQPDIGQVLDKAMDLIEEDNRAELEGVLPKIYTRTTLDHAVIGELVNIFSRISFDHDFDREKDILGRIYEYFLGQFASSEGKRGGEFFTPRSIVKLLVEILEPYENARVLDPACGSGGMFVSMGEYLLNHGQDPSKLAINGQESNQTTLRLAKMNLAIRGLSGKIELGNTYYQDKFPHLQADFVIANPPFNAEWEPSKLADNDPRITLGTPPSGSANFMWIQHFAHHLAPNGYAGFVMSNGALAGSGKESELRQKLVESDLVDVIISCPSKLFYNVSLSVSLWFLAKNKSGDRFRKRSGETLFIDASQIFEQISRKQVVFNPEHIRKITDTVRAWRGEPNVGEYQNVPGFCKSVTTEEIAKNNHILTPVRFVGLADRKNDGVSFDQELKTISAFLNNQTTKHKELDKKISTELANIYPNFVWSNIDFSSPEILDNLSQKIYTEWFIKFHFPGYEKTEFVESELGMIPKGWHIGRVKDLVRVESGFPFSSSIFEDSGQYKLVTIRNVQDGQFIPDCQNHISALPNKLPEFCKLSAGDILLSLTGNVGRVCLVNGENYVLNQRVSVLIPNHEKDRALTYFLFRRKEFQNLLISISKGTAQLNLSPVETKNLEIVIPDEKILQRYSDIVGPMFQRIVSINAENQELKESRDQLLTK